MSNAFYYRLLIHLDAPKRVLSLTLDELVIAVMGFSMLALTNHKLLGALISLGLLSVLRCLKRGQNPMILLVLAYWYLPYAVTRFFLPRLPVSHHRLYIA
jgi:conjugal transfer pilus assembly protein TraL